MTVEQLKAKFPHASKAFLAANSTPAPVAVVRVAAAVGKRDTLPALDKDAPAQPRRRGRLAVLVTIIAFRRRLLDDDNNSFKPIRDSICRSLQIDDASTTIRFQCGQQHTTGAEGSLIRIEWI